jgi:Xaa-Pro aminopeptidase
MYILITNPFDIFYLTGFMADNLLERQSYVLCKLVNNLPTKLSDIHKIWHFLPEMFAANCIESSVVQDTGSAVQRVVLKPGTKLSEQVGKIMRDDIGKRKDSGKHGRDVNGKDAVLPPTLYFQPEDMRYQEVVLLEANQDMKLESMAGMLTPLRACKSQSEVERIHLAAQRSETIYQGILKLLKPGIAELEIKKAILDELTSPNHPGFEPAFDPIVAFGPNSAIPHHRATARTLTEGEIVLIDMGASYQGYNADICRTSIFRPSADQRQVFDERLQKVVSALDAAAKYLGTRARRLDVMAGGEETISNISKDDSTVRNATHTTAELSSLMQVALGQDYPLIHAFGHGLGVQVHEGPHISSLGKSYEFKGGEVIALEPAIYIPDWGGIRIEYNYHIS